MEEGGGRWGRRGERHRRDDDPPLSPWGERLRRGGPGGLKMLRAYRGIIPMALPFRTRDIAGAPRTEERSLSLASSRPLTTAGAIIEPWRILLRVFSPKCPAKSPRARVLLPLPPRISEWSRRDRRERRERTRDSARSAPSYLCLRRSFTREYRADARIPRDRIQIRD